MRLLGYFAIGFGMLLFVLGLSILLVTAVFIGLSLLAPILVAVGFIAKLSIAFVGIILCLVAVLIVVTFIEPLDL